MKTNKIPEFKLKGYRFKYSDHYFLGLCFAKNAGQARNIAYVWIKHWESETPLGNCDHTFIDFPIAREKRIDDLRPGYISAYGGVVDIEDKLFRLVGAKHMDYDVNKDIYVFRDCK